MPTSRITNSIGSNTRFLGGGVALMLTTYKLL